MYDKEFDVAIIGGGIVGCAVIFELTRHGYKCVLLEKNSTILSEASSGNSGMLHTGFDAPLESTELECIKLTQDSIFSVMDKFHVPYTKCGTVLVAWTSEDEKQLSGIESKTSEIGIDSVVLTSSDIHKKEPLLKETYHGALFVPDETVVDPNLLGVCYAHHACRQGAEIVTSCEVRNFHDHVLDTSRGNISSRVAINCAGLHGDTVDSFIGSKSFSIKPRKGQYCVFNKSPNPVVNSIIFPVPTEKSKGVAIFKTVYDNIVCGPTAQDVLERTHPTFDSKTHESLYNHAVSLLPELTKVDVVGHYTGVRPATQFKDYQIKAYPSKNWITVGGIRSTGVSASLGIAHLVREKLFGEIGLDASRGATATVDEIQWEFQTDSCSFTTDGFTYPSAHPICHFGFNCHVKNYASVP